MQPGILEKLGQKMDNVLDTASDNLSDVAVKFKDQLSTLKDNAEDLDDYDFVKKTVVYLSFKKREAQIEMHFSLTEQPNSNPIETYVGSNIHIRALEMDSETQPE